MNGLIVVDKPVGPTSFDVVHRARRAFNTKTIGHTGTLDPLASGVLVVLVGTWTRLQNHVMAQDKRYLAKIVFGTRTSTDDRAGDVVESGDASHLTEAIVKAALADMTGTVKQRPPAHSAIHIDGERAYAKARRGEAVEIEEREVRIDALELMSWNSPAAIVDVKCGKGTYVRSIARDLGVRVGVPAHLGDLRRTASGPYSLEEAIALDDIGPDKLRTSLDAIRGIEKIAIDGTAATDLGHGKRVKTAHHEVKAAIAHVDGAPVAIVRVERGELIVERGIR